MCWDEVGIAQEFLNRYTENCVNDAGDQNYCVRFPGTFGLVRICIKKKQEISNKVS